MKFFLMCLVVFMASFYTAMTFKEPSPFMVGVSVYTLFMALFSVLMVAIK